MTYRAYGPARKFRQAKLDMIGRADAICREYGEQGLVLSVRQIYYQFVANDWIENCQESYDKIQSAVNDGRMAGLISWDAIEDRNRQLMGYRTYKKPADAMKSMRGTFKHDLWADQPWRPEVWVEKAALEGVISTICNELRVDFTATRGYNSQSEQWRAGQRFQGYLAKGQRPIVFDLRDLDPSGAHMTEDNRNRLETFVGTPVAVQRLMLNMDQVRMYNPPPNPVKKSDSKSGAYLRQYGDECYELDALKPPVIRDKIREAVMLVRDEDLWQAALAHEAEDLDRIDRIIEELDL